MHLRRTELCNQWDLPVSLSTPLSTQTLSWRRHNAEFWDSMKNFYQSRNIAAWDALVPFHITNNPDYAYRTAKLVSAYMLSCRVEGYTGSFVMIEPGAGLGQFGYLFLKHLCQLLKLAQFDSSSLTYVMCDTSDATLSFWKKHPQLRRFEQEGLLQYEQLEINPDLSVSFSFDCSSLRNQRVILITNYFMDSVNQQPFRLHDSVYVPYEINQKRSVLKQKDELSFTPVHSHHGPYSTLPFYDEVLEEHRLLDIQNVLMPDGVMSFMRWLDSLTDHPVLALASDKGFPNPQQHGYDDRFHIICTGGYASCVNFFALNRYVSLALNGSSLSSPSFDSAFCRNITLTKTALSTLPLFHMEASSSLGHGVDFYRSRTYRNLVHQSSPSTLDDLFAIFRETGHDPNALMFTFERANQMLSDAQCLNDYPVDDLLSQLREHYFFTPHQISLRELTCIVEIALTTKRYRFAEDLLSDFCQWHGQTYDYKKLSGILYFLQSDFSSSAHFFTDALYDNPDCSVCKEYIAHCEAFL